MIVDTNILLRLMDGPDAELYEEAVSRVHGAIEDNQVLTVTAATVIEASFVWRSKAAGYGYTPVEIAHEVDSLLSFREFDVEEHDVLHLAADLHAASGFDFHDCYLEARARHSGGAVLSLDGDFRKF